MTAESDSLVIGGGIIGLMSARLLARAGQRVTVLDRGQLGAEASRAAGGILCPLYPWRLPASLQEFAHLAMAGFPSLVRELEHASGRPIGFRRTGLLLLDTEEFAAARAWADRWQLGCRELEPSSLASMAPELAADQALWFPDMANVYSTDLIAALREEAEALGVVIRESVAVEGLRLSEGRIAGVMTDQGPLDADRVVIAAGAWSRFVLEQLSGTLPVRPVRGQIIQYPRGTVRLEAMVLSGRRYLVPRPEGELIVGSTLEDSGFDDQPTETARDELCRAAEDILPALREASLEAHWAGLRPGAPDGMPYIGPWPGIQGLYLNTGHYQNGILLAGVSAELLAHHMLGSPSPVAPEPFRVDREDVAGFA